MLSKSISLILVYVVTIINLLLITLPLSAGLVPFVNFHTKSIEVNDEFFHKITIFCYFIIFLISFLMLIYILFDFLFSFSVGSALKGCRDYKNLEKYRFLELTFKQVQEKFGEKNVNLYIKDSGEINAFAVSSMNRRVIVLTSGIISHYFNNSDNQEQFLFSIRSIMAHEMSHLINKDFLPTFLVATNQKATNFISKILRITFYFAADILRFVPYGGRFSSFLMTKVYNIINYFLTFSNRFLIRNVHEFIKKFVSRSIEFRCDKQAAQAFGGFNMALALAFLGDNGYFTMFSTHPSTKKRIAMVENVIVKKSTIRPLLSSFISSYLALLFLVIICLVFAKMSYVDVFLRHYFLNHENINHKIVIFYNALGNIRQFLTFIW